MSLNRSSGQSSQNRDSGSQLNSSSQNIVQSEPQTLQLRFNKILMQADQLIITQQYPQAVTKLTLLSQKINETSFQSRIRSNMIKSQNLYACIIQLQRIISNCFLIQRQWILDECIPLVDKFIIMLKSTIQQEQIKGKSHYLFKMKHLLIKTQLQYCAILSQVSDHYKALKIAIEVSESLKQFFNKGYNQVCRFLNKIQKIDSKKSLASSWGSETNMNFRNTINNDKVQFATNVLNQSKQNLSELLKIETYDQVVKQNFQKICLQLIDLKSRTYFWKDNPENNIKLLRKQLNQQKQQQGSTLCSNGQSDNQERNLLGIKKSKSWIQQITIAKVMVMSPINYLEFAEKDNIIFEFNYKNLVEKIILVSVTYFSLAIELRFIETTQKIEKEKEKQKEKQKSKHTLTVSNSQKILPSRQSKQTEKQMKKSEVFHLKSIVLLCKMVKQNSAFLNHLVMNYHKHYKQDLITIQQESSMAEYSHIYDKRSKSNSLCMKTYQNQFILPEDDEETQRQQNVLSPIKKFPRQSAYFEDNFNENENKIQRKKSPTSSKKNPLIAFKKVSSNKRDVDTSEDKSKKYMNSISISRNQTNSNVRQAKSARYPKYINQKQVLKDRTVKKISVGKMITLGSPLKLGLQTDRSKDKSTDKESSLSKFNSMRSLQKKSFSTRSIPSFSLGKVSMNSTTLKHKKRRGEKSPDKQKMKLKDLKQSTQFKRADFRKKQKQIQVQKNSNKVKDKKKQKLNSGLTLLKQSSSNPNLRTVTAAQEYHLDQDYASIKQKSKKVQKLYYKK